MEKRREREWNVRDGEQDPKKGKMSKVCIIFKQINQLSKNGLKKYLMSKSQNWSFPTNAELLKYQE